MNYEIAELFKLDMHEVGCLDSLVESGGSNVNRDHDLSNDTYDYVRRYKEPGREIVVHATETGDSLTEVMLVEKNHYLLPRAGSKFVVRSFLQEGKAILKFGWSSWLQERIITVGVASAYDEEELVEVAQRAAEKLREEYHLQYGTKMMPAPIEDMILTRLIRYIVL